jgi:hypothetical protein
VRSEMGNEKQKRKVRVSVVEVVHYHGVVEIPEDTPHDEMVEAAEAEFLEMSSDDLNKMICCVMERDVEVVDGDPQV